MKAGKKPTINPSSIQENNSPTVYVENIPQELKDKNNWVVWRYEQRPNAKPNDKPTKPPYNPITKQYALSNKPETWASFKCAYDVFIKSDGYYNGVGFMLNGLVCGIDIDHVIDNRSGFIDDQALEIISQFEGTYMEVSPSGDGFHILCIGELEKARKGKVVEVYDEKSPRYLTITGKQNEVLEGIKSNRLEAMQRQIQWLESNFDRLNGKVAKDLSQQSTAVTRIDEHRREGGDLDANDVFVKLSKSRNGDKFMQLYNGWGNEDKSAGDMNMCGMIAFYTDDENVIDQIVRSSKRYRTKWDTKHSTDGATYGQITIRKALSNKTGSYDTSYRSNPITSGNTKKDTKPKSSTDTTMNKKNNRINNTPKPVLQGTIGNLETEIIAAIVHRQDNGYWEKIEDHQFSHEFLSKREHQAIFNTCRKLHTTGKKYDLFILLEKFPKDGEIYSELVEVGKSEGVFNANLLESYIEIVLQHYYDALIDTAYLQKEPPEYIIALKNEFQERMNGKKRNRGSFEELEKMSEEEDVEPTWIIKDLITTGVTLLAGKAKSGKSWFVMQMALAISKGHNFLGEFPTTQGNVLQLSLEDTEKRLKMRYKKLGGFPKGDWYTDFPIIGGGFERVIKTHLTEDHDCRLVIVDTLSKVMPVTDKSGSYLNDYAVITEIKRLASEFPETAFLFLHHQKKGIHEIENQIDSVLGSTALVGGFDNLLFLKREGGHNKGILATTGKDLEESVYSLEHDKELQCWQYLGKGEKAAMSESRRQVIETMKKHSAETRNDLVQLTNMNEEALKRLLNRMVKDGELEINGKRGNAYKYKIVEVSDT